MELISPSPPSPPLTPRTLAYHFVVTILARQTALYIVLNLIVLILILPVYALDFFLFDYVALDLLASYFIVCAVCRLVKRCLAFPRGYGEDYWVCWGGSYPASTTTSMPPDHPLRNLDVLPAYNLHHVSAIAEVVGSLSVCEDDDER